MPAPCDVARPQGVRPRRRCLWIRDVLPQRKRFEGLVENQLSLQSLGFRYIVMVSMPISIGPVVVSATVFGRVIAEEIIPSIIKKPRDLTPRIEVSCESQYTSTLPFESVETHMLTE